MSQAICNRLSDQFGIHIDSLEELRNGHNLMSIAFKALYNEQNEFLLGKLNGSNTSNQSFSKSQLNESIMSNQSVSTKPGNNVILINTLIKHIKSDKTIILPNSIKEITFYNIIEQDQLLFQFVQWMLNYNLKKQQKQNLNHNNTNQQIQHFNEEFDSASSNRFRNIQIQSTKQKESQRLKTQLQQMNMKTQEKQTNQLQNLYFASNLKQKLPDSPLNPQPQSTDRIVRKGSFKLLKPKVMFSEENNQDKQPKQLPQPSKLIKKHNQIQQPDELKQISMIESNQNGIFTHSDHHMTNLNDSIDEIINKKLINTTPSVSRQQQNNRKTVPKNLAKPPLYRSSIKNKENNLSEQKTIEQKLKKKNFFNFDNQTEQIVSNFNYETVKDNIEQQQHLDKKYIGSDNNTSEDKMRQFYSDNIKKTPFEPSSALSRKQSKQTYKLQNDINLMQVDDSSNMQRSIQMEERKQSSNRGNMSLLSNNNNKNTNSSLLKLKNHFLQKQLYTLQNEIHQQQNQLLRHEKSVQQVQNQLSKEISRSPHLKQLKTNNKSAQSLNNSMSRNESISSVKRSSRKVSKVQLKPLDDSLKKDIINWLHAIHIINSSFFNTEDQLIQMFHNGVKFVQLCNHYIGRGRSIPYFKNPKKNAEIHSNFNKVFEHLRSFSQFSHNQKIFTYELFVPVPQQGYIWALLQAIYRLFQRKIKKKSNKQVKDLSNDLNKTSQIYNSCFQRQKFQSNEFEKDWYTKNYDQKDDEIKFQEIKNKKSYSSFKNYSVSPSRKQTTFSKPIEFVPLISHLPQHNGLIQQSQQPQENDQKNILNINQNTLNGNIFTQGYKQKYLRKAIDTSKSKEHNNKSAKNFFSLQTPKKSSISNHQQTFIVQNRSRIMNSSGINKSSSKKALESQVKKLQNSSQKITSIRKHSSKSHISNMPKVTLHMQMKVEKVINEYQLGSIMNQSHEDIGLKRPQLFQDPVRNGTIINLILSKITNQQIKYLKLPQSIQNCRQNYSNVNRWIKNKYGQQMFESNERFMEIVEEILKGEKNMFYVVTYQMVQIFTKHIGQNSNPNYNKVQGERQNAFMSSNSQKHTINCNDSLVSKDELIKLYEQNQLQWVKLLELLNPAVSSMRIRSLQNLHSQISTGALLYSLLQNPTVNMVYMHPQSIQQKQANLKKVLVYMIQMKIFKREEFTNIRQIAQLNLTVINDLIRKLIQYTVNKEWSYIQRNITNLVRMLGQGKLQNKIDDHSSNKGLKNMGNNNQAESSINCEKNQTIHLKNTTQNLNFPSKQQVKHKEKPETLRQKQQFEVEIPWMRKLGFTNCSLNLNNGILLCRLISKLTRTNIKFNENISHDAQICKPQALNYIRKALKLIPGCKLDELDVYHADERKTLEIYSMIREKFKGNYEMGKVVSVR